MKESSDVVDLLLRSEDQIIKLSSDLMNERDKNIKLESEISEYKREISEIKESLKSQDDYIDLTLE